MAKKSGVAAQGLSALFNLTSMLGSRADTGGATVTQKVRLPRISSEVLDYLSTLYNMPRKELIALATTQVKGMTNQAETMKILQEVARQFTLDNARTRTLELTQGSLKTVNDLSKRLGLSPDAVMAALLSLIGADLDILTRKRREQLLEALKTVERLRDHAERTEAELVEILGARHPIAWDKITGGINSVHDELRQELHNLTNPPTAAKPAATSKPEATEPKTPKKQTTAKRKPAAKKKASAKPKAKARTNKQATAKKKPAAKKKTTAKKKAAAKRKPAAKKR